MILNRIATYRKKELYEKRTKIYNNRLNVRKYCNF